MPSAKSHPSTRDLPIEIPHTTLLFIDVQNFCANPQGAEFKDLTAPEFDQIVNQQILPPWNNEKATLQKLRIEGQQKVLVDRLISYMTLRAEGWSLTAQGIRRNDSALIQQANQKQVEAEAVVKSLDK